MTKGLRGGIHIKRSTAGRKEDVREKCTRMLCTATNDSERLFLAALAEGLAGGLPIRIGNEEWVVERSASARGGEGTGGRRS